MRDITHFNSYEAGLEAQVDKQVGCGTARKVEVGAPFHQAILRERTSSAFGIANILLAEDDLIVRNFLTAALTREGYRIIQACDGREAILLWHEYKPIDLIIADVNMPGLRGPLLAEAIWVEEFTPVLYISGLPPGDLVEQHIRNGHARFLAKPFQLGALRKSVQAFVEVPRSLKAAH